MKFKKNNVLGIFSVAFASIGVLMMLISAVIFFNHYSFNKNTPETKAVIEEIRTSVHRISNGKRRTDHDVYVSYVVDDKSYYRELGYYNSGMREGDTVYVHYDPADPNKIKTNSYIGEIIIFPMGVIFAGIGGCFAAFVIKESKRKKFLIQNGIRTLATVTDIVTDTSTTVNGRHPNMIKCEIVDDYTGQIRSYTSDSSFNDYSAYLGMPVNIYVNPTNPNEAFVDIQSLVEQSMIGMSKF